MRDRACGSRVGSRRRAEQAVRVRVDLELAGVVRGEGERRPDRSPGRQERRTRDAGAECERRQLPRRPFGVDQASSQGGEEAEKEKDGDDEDEEPGDVVSTPPLACSPRPSTRTATSAPTTLPDSRTRTPGNPGQITDPTEPGEQQHSAEPTPQVEFSEQIGVRRVST